MFACSGTCLPWSVKLSLWCLYSNKQLATALSSRLRSCLWHLIPVLWSVDFEPCSKRAPGTSLWPRHCGALAKRIEHGFAFPPCCLIYFLGFRDTRKLTKIWRVSDSCLEWIKHIKHDAKSFMACWTLLSEGLLLCRLARSWECLWGLCGARPEVSSSAFQAHLPARSFSIHRPRIGEPLCLGWFLQDC